LKKRKGKVKINTGKLEEESDRNKPVIAPINDTAHNLGLEIVIEGNETMDQF
jgi:sensor c-di-GMP phosphodiesterase-like protein